MQRRCGRAEVAIAVAGLLAVGGAMPARGAEVGGAEGWKVSVGGLINAFAVNARWKVGNGEEETTRVSSGFNPSKLNVVVKAPGAGGVDVSGHFQLAPSIQSNKAKFAGQSLEVRIAEIDVTGRFGTLEIGRGWSIFNSQTTINDTASGLGVGRIPSPDRGGPTFGRIGAGYTYTDFTTKIAYASPDLSGFQVRAGLFDPIEQPFGGSSLPSNSGGTGVGALETKGPRVEAEASYAVKAGSVGFKVWAGALDQSIRDKGTGSSTSISGVDGGARLDVAGLGLTGAYTTTKGVGPSGFQGNGFVCEARGCRSSRTDFWYAGADYTFGDEKKTTFGGSVGRGEQEAKNGFAAVDNELQMVFLQHQLLAQLHVMVEYHRFETKTESVVSEKYDAFIVGTQFNF